MAFIDQNLRSRRTISVSAVIAVHLAIGYALVTGLAYEVIKQRITVMWAREIPAPKIPSPPVHQKQKIEKQWTVPKGPLVKHPAGTDTGPVPQADPTPKVPEQKPAPLSPPTYSRSVQPGRDHATWVTPDDYPPSSVRNDEEGAVRISVRVGTDGRVLSCQVTASSGYSDLDQATCRYYSRRARFTPALSADGTPVESSYNDRVVWRLPAQ